MRDGELKDFPEILSDRSSQISNDPQIQSLLTGIGKKNRDDLERFVSTAMTPGYFENVRKCDSCGAPEQYLIKVQEQFVLRFRTFYVYRKEIQQSKEGWNITWGALCDKCIQNKQPSTVSIRQNLTEIESIPKKFKNTTFESYVSSNESGIKKIKKLLVDKKSIVFFGVNGSGKTHIACAGLQWLIKEKVYFPNQVLFITANALVEKITSLVIAQHYEAKTEIFNKGAIVIDELGGIKSSSENPITTLSELICHREANDLQTIMTTDMRIVDSNQTAAEFLGTRIWERITRMNPIELKREEKYYNAK